MEIQSIVKNDRHHVITASLNNEENELILSGNYNIGVYPKFFNFKKGIENYRIYKIDHRVVVNIILNYFNVSIYDVRSTYRSRKMVDVRMFLSHYLRKFTFLILSDIGRIFKRDHASVIHMIKRLDIEIKYEDCSKKKDDLDSIFNNLINSSYEITDEENK